MCTVDNVQNICFLINYCSLLKISVSLINISLMLHGFTDLVVQFEWFRFLFWHKSVEKWVCYHDLNIVRINSDDTSFSESSSASLFLWRRDMNYLCERMFIGPNKDGTMESSHKNEFIQWGKKFIKPLLILYVCTLNGSASNLSLLPA